MRQWQMFAPAEIRVRAAENKFWKYIKQHSENNFKKIYKKNEPGAKLLRYSLCKEVKMDDISKLLQEAKPLYFSRKRQRNRIKVGICTLVGVVMLSLFVPQKSSYIDNGEWVDYEQYISQVSPIEEMGLPVDEFGLLMVG